LLVIRPILVDLVDHDFQINIAVLFWPSEHLQMSRWTQSAHILWWKTLSLMIMVELDVSRPRAVLHVGVRFFINFFFFF
jgi:hypothetical protein